MKSNIKNIFGVATAILVLLGLNTATNFSTFNLPFLNTEILPAEEKELISLKDFNDAMYMTFSYSATVRFFSRSAPGSKTHDPFFVITMRILVPNNCKRSGSMPEQ